jgi:hypothetical protein
MILAFLGKISPNELLFSNELRWARLREAQPPSLRYQYYAPLELKATFLYRTHVKLSYKQ